MLTAMVDRTKARLWLAAKAEKAMGSSFIQRIEKDDAQSLTLPVQTAMPVVERAGKPLGKPAAAQATLIEETPLHELPFDTPAIEKSKRAETLHVLDDSHVKGCTRCRLCETRTQTVFGDGDANARLMFIGEGPGENEDLEGRPFVGKAGQLLEKMINAMGLARADVFIANVVKCRPPGNRVPQPDEVEACTPYLTQQIKIIRPEVIVTLGLPASQYVLDSRLSMGKLRGAWRSYRGIRVMPTYHPAYVLRSYTAEVRGMVWSDLKMVMDALGMTSPGAESKGAKQ